MVEQHHQRAILLQFASAFPPPPGVKLSYGTAGFRAEGSILASTVFRTGVLAALRSLKMGGATVGLMITASHNPVRDNGVKVADPSGGMMTQRWEPFADALANAPTAEDLVQLVFGFVKEEEIPIGGVQSAEVLLGRDTRPSGEALLEAAKQGVAAVVGAAAIDMGVLTTPQLHWMVRCRNKGNKVPLPLPHGHQPTTNPSTPWRYSFLFPFSSLPDPAPSPYAPADGDGFFPSLTSGPPSQESILYVLKMLDTNPQKALNFLNCATSRYGFKPGARVYNLMLRILGGSKQWAGDFWAIARKMRDGGHSVERGTYITLLVSFKKQDMPDDASALVQFQSQASEAAMSGQGAHAAVQVLSAAEEWNDDAVGKKLEDVKLVLSETTVLKLLSELRDQPMKALGFFRWAERKPDYKHGCAAYNAMARILRKQGTIVNFWHLVEEMRREGHDMDIDTYVKLSRQFQRCKMIREAVQLYEYAMDGPYKPSMQDCGLLLRQISLADEPDLDLVFRVVKKYEAHGHSLSKAVYDGIHRSLTSVGKFDEAEQVLEKMTSAGFEPDNITYSQLIYGLCKAKRLHEARKVLDDMEAAGCVPDLKTWTILIQGHCLVGEVDKALTCFTDMIGQGYEADGDLLDIMVKGLCSKQRVSAAYTLVLEMLETAQLRPWQATYKLLIQKLLGEGKLEEALKLLSLMKGHNFLPYSEPFATYISKYGTIEDARELLKTLSPKSSPTSTYLNIFKSFFKEGRYSEAQELLFKCPHHVRKHADISRLFGSLKHETPS